jgi:hypothetical protein
MIDGVACNLRKEVFCYGMRAESCLSVLIYNYE